MENIIFAFRSRTELDRTASVLAKNGVVCRAINTPFNLGMSCGLSLVSDVGNYNVIMQIASQNHLNFNAVIKAVETPNGTKYVKMK